MVWNLFYSCRIVGLGMPLDDEDGSIFSVLLNDEEQHSLWLACGDYAAELTVRDRKAERACTATGDSTDPVAHSPAAPSGSQLAGTAAHHAE